MPFTHAVLVRLGDWYHTQYCTSQTDANAYADAIRRNDTRLTVHVVAGGFMPI